MIRSAFAAMLWENLVAQLEIAGGSYREAALGTLLSLTNETLNAWTTICGFLGITSLYIYSMCAAVRSPCLTLSCCLFWNAFVVCVHFCNLSGAVRLPIPKFCCLSFLEIPIGCSQLQTWTRVRLPHGAAPFTLFYLSALLHNPVSIACSCFIGVSDAARAFWRMLDVMLIFTCAGASC